MKYLKEQKKTHPQLLDIVIEQLKDGMKKNLPWLDQAFGRVWKITRNVNGKKYTEPCIYCEGNSYESLIPSSDLGNYCFFVLQDPTEVDEQSVSARCSVVFWVDLRKCFDSEDVRDTEVLKNDLVRGFQQDIWVKGGRFDISKIYEEGKNVFAGFTIDEDANRYMMQPYAAFRVEGRIKMLIQTC